jgi:hypothetical protein
VVLALVVAVPPLVRGSGRAWSLPRAAPLLGAPPWPRYPALAGRAPRAWQRAGLGAAGVWWLLLAEALLERTLLVGAAAPAALERRRRRGAARCAGRRR